MNLGISMAGRTSGLHSGGPVYVLLRGFSKLAAVMLLISAGLTATAAAIAIAIVGLMDPHTVNLLAVIGIPLAAMTLQSVIAIQLMRAGFMRRGWREGH